MGWQNQFWMPRPFSVLEVESKVFVHARQASAPSLSYKMELGNFLIFVCSLTS